MSDTVAPPKADELANAAGSLKHAETADKSAPMIEKDTKIGKNPLPDVLKDVAKGTDLKHVDTNDKSAPAIEADTKIGKNNNKEVFSEAAEKARRLSADATQ